MMSAFRASVSVWLLLAGACTSKSHSSAADGGALEARATAAYCDYLERCEPARLSGAGQTAQSCREQTCDTRWVRGLFLLKPDTGTTQEELERCLRVLPKAACRPVASAASAQYASLCERLERPFARAGESCVDRDCEDGFICDKGPSGTCPVCKPRRQRDESCLSCGGPLCLFACEPGDVCDGNGRVCARAPDEGERCGPESGCKGSLHCVDGVCRRPLASGEPCTRNRECVDYQCAEGSCGARAQLGEACGDSQRCAAPLHCEEGMCVPWSCELGDLDERCPCAPGFWCDAATQRCAKVGKVGEPCPSGQNQGAAGALGALGGLGGNPDGYLPCEPNAFCDATGRCAERGQAGRPCEGDAQCAAGLFCERPSTDPQGTCRALRRDGDACQVATECASFTCFGDKCGVAACGS